MKINKNFLGKNIENHKFLCALAALLFSSPPRSGTLPEMVFCAQYVNLTLA